MGSTAESPALIAMDEFRRRQARTLELVQRQGLDALLAVGRSAYDRPGQLAYLTNHFPPFPSTPFTETDRGMGYGMLLLPLEGDTTLLVDRQSKASLQPDRVAARDIRVAADMMAGLVDLLKERKLERGRIGIAGEDLLPATIYRHLLEQLPGLQSEPADQIITAQRLIKSEAEIALLRRAAQVAGAGHAAAQRILKPGVRENELCAEGTAGALRAGADFVRYFRVASDPEVATTMRWPQASARAVQEGEIVMMDIIGACHGYQFDVFRTPVAGAPNPQRRRLLEAVAAATDAALTAAQVGTPAERLVQAARDVLDREDYGPYARDFMGHGIGLETVEPPLISAGDTTPLQAGMVLCIEPGLRIPGVGGCCIEQEVVIREGGPELLTEFPVRLW